MNRDSLGRFAKEAGVITGSFITKAIKAIISFLIEKPANWAWTSFKALEWRRKLDLCLIALLIMIPVCEALASKIPQNHLIYRATRVEAAEIVPKDATLEQMKEELAHIVWKGETGNYKMEKGEIFPVFDPSPSMYQKCIRVGGKQHIDCLSYGPFQEKIGTIMYYWPQLHKGETISESEARSVAEGMESSKQFFLDCSIQIEGCAWNWTAALNNKAEVALLIKLIRQAQ